MSDLSWMLVSGVDVVRFDHAVPGATIWFAGTPKSA